VSDAQAQPVVLVRRHEQDGVGVQELVLDCSPRAGPADRPVVWSPEAETNDVTPGAACRNRDRYHRAVIMAQVTIRTTAVRKTLDLVDDLFQLCAGAVLSRQYGRHISPHYCWYALMLGLSDSPV